MDLIEHWYRLQDDFRRVNDPSLRLKCTGWIDTWHMTEVVRSNYLKRFGIAPTGLMKAPMRSGLWFISPYPQDCEFTLYNDSLESNKSTYRAIAQRAGKLMLVTPQLAHVDEMLESSDPLQMWFEYVEWVACDSYRVNRFAIEHDAALDNEPDLFIQWDIHPLSSATDYVIHKIISEFDPPPPDGAINGVEDTHTNVETNRAEKHPTDESKHKSTEAESGKLSMFGQMNSLREALAVLRSELNREPTVKELRSKFRDMGNEANDTDLGNAIHMLEERFKEYKRPSNRGRKRRDNPHNS